MRLGLAETMARPNLSELAPTSSNNAINGTPQLFYNGTAGLKPVKANQADLSLEWYYAAHSALTIAVFVEEDQGRHLPGGRVEREPRHAAVRRRPAGHGARHSLPVDGDRPRRTAPRARYSGVELTWQHIMENGFGTACSSPRPAPAATTSSATSSGAINAAPPTTFSIGLLYEKGPWARTSTGTTSRASPPDCSQCTEVPGMACDLRCLRLGHGEPALPLLARLRDLRRGQEPEQLDRTQLPQRQSALPWAPGQNVGASESGTGIGYSAYGRTYVLGLA